MSAAQTEWLGQRKYFAKAEGVGRGTPILVALAAPRKLESHERPFESEVNSYGCLVQTGAEFTRRTVSGRDPLEALFNALLAIEVFLVSASREQEIVDESGKPLDMSHDGLLLGPIGTEYLRELGLRGS